MLNKGIGSFLVWKLQLIEQRESLPLEHHFTGSLNAVSNKTVQGGVIGSTEPLLRVGLVA